MADAENVFICSGHLKRGGVDVLSNELKKAVSRGARITVYSNLEDTESRAVIALKKLGVEHIVVNGFYLHTKLYFFQTGDSFSAYIGSANITKNALTSNEEFSVLLTGKTGDDRHREIAAYAAYLDSRCRGCCAASTAKRRKAKSAMRT
ncbi:hypothetical protein BZM26_09750 [Paraburkholderia strydomiana]|nr:hypothetical protein BZM26_09750 [Paraburkholderia strydomiana]